MRSAPFTPAARATPERAPSAPITERARSVNGAPSLPFSRHSRVTMPSASRLSPSNRPVRSTAPSAPAQAAQPVVELLPVDHADEPVLDRHVGNSVGGGEHPGRGHARRQQLVGDREVLDEAGRDGAAAGFDAAPRGRAAARSVRFWRGLMRR